MIHIISQRISNLKDIKVLAKEETEEAAKNKKFQMLIENFANIQSVEKDPYLPNL